MLVIHKSNPPVSLFPSKTVPPIISALAWTGWWEIESWSSFVLLPTNSDTSILEVLSKPSVTNCSCWTGTWIPEIVFISPSSACFFSVSRTTSVVGETSGCPVEVTRAHRALDGKWTPTDESLVASSKLKLLEWKAPIVVYKTSGSVSLEMLPQLTALRSAAKAPWDESVKSTAR